MTSYEFWSYHNSPVDPVRRTDELIFGLELEIDRNNPVISTALDELIEEEVVGSPDNEGYSSINVQIENSSVYAELIFNANYKNGLINSLRVLNDYGLTPENVPNQMNGTSAHISFSNNHLESRGITRTNLSKMCELYSPVLFAISERRKREAYRWAKPQAYDLGFVDWYTKLLKVEVIDPFISTRYTLLNCLSSYKSELRIFSNNNGGFDANRIEFYLSICEFILDMCEEMKGKRYRTEYENLINKLENFILTEYPAYYQKYGLKKVFHPDKEIFLLQKQINSRHEVIRAIDRKLQVFKEQRGMCSAMTVLKEAINRGFTEVKLEGLAHFYIMKFAENIIAMQYHEIYSYGMQYLRNHHFNPLEEE